MPTFRVDYCQRPKVEGAVSVSAGEQILSQPRQGTNIATPGAANKSACDKKRVVRSAALPRGQSRDLSASC